MPQAARGLLEIRRHVAQSRSRGGQRLREEAHDVRRHEQSNRLVQEPRVTRGEEDQRQRDDQPGQRVTRVAQTLGQP